MLLLCVCTVHNKNKMADAAAAAAKPTRKVPSSLLSLTYGALVAQLLRDMQGDVDKVNLKLDQMGESMGSRMIDEVLSKANIRRCGGVFKEAMQLVSTVGFKFYWNVQPQVTSWNAEGTQCSLVFTNETPLEEFVEIPDQFTGLKYTQLLCGIIRGALQCVNIKTTCEIARDRLRGEDEVTEIRVTLIEISREMAGEDYQEE